jgi:hypothetical protein
VGEPQQREETMFRMSSLPRVSAGTRERVSREFDDLGPAACTTQVVQVLERDNPELLDMITKCVRDIGRAGNTMAGFAMFYRLLVAEMSYGSGGLKVYRLPRVEAKTRDLLVKKIDAQGPEAFVMDAVDDLEKNNPDLLQMAHIFASRHSDYLRMMQGFALIYRSLVLQLSADRARLH